MEKNWLGDLDSNQDSQLQRLVSYQLDDLPTRNGSLRDKEDSPRCFNLSRINGSSPARQPSYFSGENSVAWKQLPLYLGRVTFSKLSIHCYPFIAP